MLSAGLAAVLAEFGLPPDPDLQIEERQLVLSPFPPSYRGSVPDGAASPRLPIRPTPFDQSLATSTYPPGAAACPRSRPSI